MKAFPFIVFVSALFPAALSSAQDTSVSQPTPLAASAATVVPALVPFSGTAFTSDAKPLTGKSSITFLLFKDENGGEPLYVETQAVVMDSNGRFKVQLGATSPSGLPANLFSTGEARWLEVQIAGQKPQPRVLLSSVPYAMKASDAATLGGLPASAFVLAGSQLSALATAGAAAISPDASSGVTTPGGTTNYVPLFTSASTIANSQIYDAGTGVGIGDIPNKYARLDVNGEMIMRGNMQVTRAGNATSAKGYPSYGFQFFSSAYNSYTKALDNPYFSLQSEPTYNNTPYPSATFNLLFANNGAAAAETGFWINPNGQVHFAPGQSFPGSVTSVGLVAPSDFTVSGSPLTGSGSLGFSWNTPPTNSATANSFVRRDSNGGFDGFTINSNLLSTNLLNVGGLAYFAGRLGIGLNNPAAELNLDAGGTANADSLLLGNLQQKGLQLRNNGTGVDIESIGVPLNINFATQQPTYINPNGGQVFLGNGAASKGSGYTASLVVGGVLDGGDSHSQSAYFTDQVQVNGEFSVNSDAYVFGNLNVSGSKNFKIDHPLDPSNKYLKHAAIESSEVLNQYSGNVVTDGNGSATIQLPEWFGAENIDFRYQLTVVGGRFAQAIISKEIENNQFTISTNAPSVKVSWQVTAKRNDAYMRAHPFQVEEDKPEGKRGFYDHPELFGQPDEKRTGGPRRQAAKPGSTGASVSAPQ